MKEDYDYIFERFIVLMWKYLNIMFFVTVVKEIFSSELNKRRPDCSLVNLSMSGVSKKIPNLKAVCRGYH